MEFHHFNAFCINNGDFLTKLRAFLQNDANICETPQDSLAPWGVARALCCGFVDWEVFPPGALRAPTLMLEEPRITSLNRVCPELFFLLGWVSRDSRQCFLGSGPRLP